MNKLQSFGKRYQTVLLFIVAFGLLFMNFFDHRLSVLSTNRFIENEYGSERFVIHRLAYNLTHDPDDFGGLMVAYNMPVWDRTSSADFSAKVKELEEKIQNGDRPEIYPSHSAFQLTILQPVWAGLGALRDKVLSRAKPDSRVANRLQNDWAYYLYYISQALVAALSACVLTFFILWVRREFTLATAYITLAGILVLCPPPDVFRTEFMVDDGPVVYPDGDCFLGICLIKKSDTQYVATLDNRELGRGRSLCESIMRL